MARLQKQARREGPGDALAQELALWSNRADHLRDYLTRSNLPLVGFVFGRMEKRLGLTDPDEAFSDGMAGLLRAINGYNARVGTKFSTYAVRCIINALRATSAKARTRAKRISRQPLSPAQEDKVSRRQQCDPDRQEAIDALRRVLDNNAADLSPTQQYILEQRFLAPRPPLQREVARTLGVTRGRVLQLQRAALDKLRAVLAPSDDNLP